MRKVKYTLLMAVILLATISNAQTHFGIRTGINITDVNSKLYIDAINNAPQSYTSAFIGGFAEFEINSNFSLQPELLYINRGFTVDQGTSIGVFGLDIPIGAKATTRISYIDVPLLAKGKIGNGITSFYGLVGPSIGYAVGGEIQPKVTFLIDWNLPSMDLNLGNDIYNRTDISGIIGAGVEHKVGSGKIFADVRYQHSFTNMLDDPIADVSIKNRGFQLGLGYSHSF